MEKILLPGEIERIRYAEYMQTGTELSEAIQSELALPAKKIGVPFEGESFTDLLRCFSPEN